MQWWGGKKRSARHIIEHAPHDIGRYWEPFLGGGYIYFSLEYRIESAYLSDINEKLITTYKMVAEFPDEICSRLCLLAPTNTRVQFMKIKDLYNNTSIPIDIATYMIYLNQCCYNAKYTVDKKGKFNAQYGHEHKKIFNNVSGISEASIALKKAEIKHHTYHDINPVKGDFVYCDPPYYKTFNGYDKDKFPNSEQIRLRDCCVKWRDAGVNVIASNSDSDFIRDIYSDFEIIEIRISNHINSDVKHRGFINELMIIGNSF